ncbi:hypothetical protein ACW73L_00395 [Methylolobus aquaticus]
MKLPYVFARAVCGLLWAGAVAAGPSDPTLELPARDRKAIEDVAGAGLIVAALPAPRLSNPAQFLELDAAPRVYRVRDRDNGEIDETHRWESPGMQSMQTTWRYRAGDSETGLVERTPDGSFEISGIEDLKEKALTRYTPAEPLLVKGMVPGEERTRRMEVQVYDPADATQVMHRGTLELAHRYLGAYRINTPSGVHDVILTRSVFDGNVGPAHLRDVQYRFFAKGIGIVATVEARDVTAAVIYNSEVRVARLLVARPLQQAECSAAAAALPPAALC